MLNLKRSFFWTSIYLITIFILGQADLLDRPIINFASYFYLAVLVAIPLTLFIPSISRAPYYVPLLVWAGIYLVVLNVIDRGPSTETIDYAVIVLEFILLELGVWLSHQLSKQISQTESLMDSLAQGVFPSRVREISQEYARIQVEFARCRRYNRPLSLIVIKLEAEPPSATRAIIKSVQQDLSHHFQSAKASQVIDDHIRQTDLLLKDHKDRYVILCPETGSETAAILAERIVLTLQEKVDLVVHLGSSVFPGDALSFDELLQKAYASLKGSSPGGERSAPQPGQ